MAYIGSTPTSQSFTPGTDYFSGDGSTVAFTLTRPAVSINDLIVVIENVVQKPLDAYTVVGTTLTFTSAPPSGTNNIYVRYLSVNTLAVTPNDLSVNVNKIQDGAVTATKLHNTAITGSLGYTPANAINGFGFFKNRIINGDFSNWQRGISFSAPSTVAYTADRWVSLWGSSNRVVSRESGFSGSQYSMRVARTVGTSDTSYTGVMQILESSNVASLQGKTITLSFDARKGANYSGSNNVLLANISTGTVADQGGSTWWSPGWTGVIFNQTSVTLSETAQRYTYSITVPSNALELAVAFQYQASGTAGAADYFEVTNVQLEIGEASNFDYRPIYEELLCKRYYYRLQGVIINLAQYNQSSNYCFTLSSFCHPVPMRVAPSFAHNLTAASRVTTGPTADQWTAYLQNAGYPDLSYTNGVTIQEVLNANGTSLISNIGGYYVNFASPATGIRLGSNKYFEFSAEL